MRIKWIYFLPCIVLTPALAKAQGNLPVVNNAVLNDAMSQVMSQMTKMAALTPKMAPAVSTIDPENKTATLTLSSLSKDTLEVTLSLTADSAGHSLVPWIKDLPKTVIIPPKGKQEVTVTLDVPKDAAAGTYSAKVRATGQKKAGSEPASQKNTGMIVMTASPDMGPSSKLVYTVK